MDLNVIVGTAMGVVAGVIIAVVAGRFLEKKTDLRYRIVSSGDVVPKETKVPLEISYKGVPVKSLVQIRCTWTNCGDVPIQNVPVVAKFNTNGTYQSVSSTDTDKLTLELVPTFEFTSMSEMPMKLVLLNPGEIVSFEWLVGGDPNPHLTVSARAVGVVAREDRPPRRKALIYPIPLLGSVGSALVGALLVAGLVSAASTQSEFVWLFFALTLAAMVISVVIILATVAYFSREFPSTPDRDKDQPREG